MFEIPAVWKLKKTQGFYGKTKEGGLRRQVKKLETNCEALNEMEKKIVDEVITTNL